MSLEPGEEIGEEVHNGHDQFFRVEEGDVDLEIEGDIQTLRDGDAVIVPSGARHNVVNRSSEVAKLYTIYAPAEHPDGLEQVKKV